MLPPPPQNLNNQAAGTFNFTCTPNAPSNGALPATNTSYSFQIYTLNQLYGGDQDYKDHIVSQLYEWPYPTSQFLLATVKANADLTNTPPVRRLALLCLHAPDPPSMMPGEESGACSLVTRNGPSC